MRSVFVNVLVIGCLMVAPAFGAQQVYVDAGGTCGGQTPCFTTIQGGVDKAGPAPARVSVFPGTYNESVDLSNMGIAIPESPGDITFTKVRFKAKPRVVPPPNGRAFFNSSAPFPGYVTIRGFRVTSADRDAINLDDVQGDVRIENVMATDAKFDGVDVDAAGMVTIKSSTARANGDDGFQVFAGEGVRISLSRAIDNGDIGTGDGFEITVEDGDVTIFGSKAKGNGDDGFNIEPKKRDGTQEGTIGKVLFLGSHALQNGAEGLEVGISSSSSSPPQRIDNVKIGYASARSNGDDGFQVEEVAGTVKIFATRSIGNGGDGFEIGSDLDEVPAIVPDHVILDKVIAERNGQGGSSGGDGIEVNGAEVVRISRSRANDNGTKGESNDGFDVDGSRRVTITKSEAKRNADEGFQVGNDANVEINNVEISQVCARDNGEHGLLVQEAGGDLAIEKSEFKSNNDVGVCLSEDLFGQSNVATKNNIVGNTDGMVLDADITVVAERNWWGNRSGPTHPTNPGGSGDTVIDSANDGYGFGMIDFTPFRGRPAFTKTGCNW